MGAYSDTLQRYLSPQDEDKRQQAAHARRSEQWSAAQAKTDALNAPKGTTLSRNSLPTEGSNVALGNPLSGYMKDGSWQQRLAQMGEFATNMGGMHLAATGMHGVPGGENEPPKKRFYIAGPQEGEYVHEEHPHIWSQMDGPDNHPSFDTHADATEYLRNLQRDYSRRNDFNQPPGTDYKGWMDPDLGKHDVTHDAEGIVMQDRLKKANDVYDAHRKFEWDFLHPFGSEHMPFENMVPMSPPLKRITGRDTPDTDAADPMSQYLNWINKVPGDRGNRALPYEYNEALRYSLKDKDMPKVTGTEWSDFNQDWQKPDDFWSSYGRR